MSTGNKYILAIDLGTSGPKVAIVSTTGDVIDCEIESNPVYHLPDGGVEQNPDEWWAAIKKAAGRLLAKQLVAINDVVAISCTAQWSGTVAVDEQGNHLMNAIIWMDARGASHVQQVTNSLLKIEGYGVDKLWRWIRLTGGIPTRSGKDPIAHILYIKKELPDIYQRTHKFLEPKDYLNLRLTGQFAAGYDSIALHWVTDNRDINHIAYDDKLLKMATLEREKLPDLKSAVDILGPVKLEVAHELGVNPGTPVVMGTPDLHSATIGSGAVRDYEAHLYIGTSSWLTCHVPFKKTDLFHNMASMPSAIPGRYFIANEQESAGVCLAFLRDNILYHQDELLRDDRRSDIYQVFDRIVAKTPAGSNGLIFMPWLNGERTPVEDHTVRGGFYNMSLSHNREDMIRAVFEGVAYNSRWLLKYVEQFVKRRLDVINMIGGGANSDIWCQIFADVLNRTIRQVKAPIQANARGAASLASVALGYATFDDISDQIQIANIYEPNAANRRIYDELFQEFLTLYQNNRKTYARLNRQVH
ncbi:MAG: xylulose kinase [Chloroflexi bacterium]|nr:xylulose kinase [Chloroflexota bacterium]